MGSTSSNNNQLNGACSTSLNDNQLNGACSKYGKEKDMNELMEYSVVYTDRAYNLMSSKFQKCMLDLNDGLKQTYNGSSVVFIPGSGTYAMECAARQFGMKKKCMVLRNGYFSFRWSDIFAACDIPEEEIVLMGKPLNAEEKVTPKFKPYDIEEVVAKIISSKPDVLFAPHVETSTGIILSDDYIKQVSEAVHSVGGVFVLDCIASGTIWVDMKALGIDCVITAPQKGWSGPACVGICVLSDKATDMVEKSNVTDHKSFACNMKKWLEVTRKYEDGGFMYYTTPPTNSLIDFRNAMQETMNLGLKQSKQSLQELGSKVRDMLESHGYPSVAADGARAPGVVVSYTDDANMVAKFKKEGVQVAGGVPFKINEPEGLKTFRIGLFGLDKINNIDLTVQRLEEALLRVKNQ